MNANKEMIRFLIVGVIANAIDFSVYYLLFHFLSFSISKGVSFSCAGIVGYWLNKYWALRHNQPSSFSEVGRYVFVIFLALIVNVLINKVILGMWPGAVVVALIMASITAGLFAFICFKWWVFRKTAL